MGCDIHVVLERRQAGDNQWVGILSTDAMKDRPTYARRDYGFFAEIANVRGEGSHYPQNLPKDISILAWQEYMRRPTDHHSASYMTVEMFCEIHNRLNPSQSRKEHSTYDLMGIYGDEKAVLRVVFWFDN